MSERTTIVEADIHTQEAERDADLRVLSGLRSLSESVPGSFFLVTGSYAIEGLTHTPLEHDDLDGNIFTPNMGMSLARTANLIENLGVRGRRFTLYKRTDDRLEYDVVTPAYNQGAKRLEIQFVDYQAITMTPTTVDFSVLGKDGRVSHVPSVLFPATETQGAEVTLRAKSCAYLIATWAIRISGAAESQKRAVRPSDIEHLRMLLKGDYSPQEVVTAIQTHVQAPSDIDANGVFSAAIGICQQTS